MQSNGPGDVHFDVVRRGYDREQVDERMRFLGAELSTAERALTAARERAATLEDELASARSELGRRTPETGFGNRVEKILRLAEDEAAEIVERARAEAEQELERLTALREDVQQRLRSTQKVLDEHFDPSWQDE